MIGYWMDFMAVIGFKRLTGSAAGLAEKFSEFLKNRISRTERRNGCCEKFRKFERMNRRESES